MVKHLNNKVDSHDSKDREMLQKLNELKTNLSDKIDSKDREILQNLNELKTNPSDKIDSKDREMREFEDRQTRDIYLISAQIKELNQLTSIILNKLNTKSDLLEVNLKAVPSEQSTTTNKSVKDQENYDNIKPKVDSNRPKK